MDFQMWIAFAISTLVIAAIPGPGVASIIGFAIGSGRRVAMASVVGMAIGNAIAVSVSLVGAAAVLATSALMFSVLKWLGAIYLVAIGVFAIVRGGKSVSPAQETSSVSIRTALMTNVVIGTLHPKTILFFAAFSAQFIRDDRPYLPQAIVLVITFTLVAALIDALYALTASQASEMLHSDRAKTLSQRAGGGLLITAGLAMAAFRR